VASNLDDATCTVSTAAGAVRGSRGSGVVEFLGIPYGAAQVGELRFAAPRPRDPWEGVLDATRFGPRPPQPEMATTLDVPRATGPMGEDCLRVNVSTPGPDGSRPVMVWLHGGGLAFGSADEYDGSRLAANNDVVVVTVGYRLGLLGFADLSPCGPEHAGSASNGFRDQILALRMGAVPTSPRSAAMPGNVTVFGQSGGGVSILALLGSHPARPGCSTGRSSSAPARRSPPRPRSCRSSPAPSSTTASDVAKLPDAPPRALSGRADPRAPAGHRVHRRRLRSTAPSSPDHPVDAILAARCRRGADPRSAARATRARCSPR
jgi:para-nitrobenzyl esterase